LAKTPSCKKRKILITAGPTREMLDPVRFISNMSTGEMGYSLADIASKKDWDVTLISGPTALKPPKLSEYIAITSAAELKKACEKEFPKHDVLVMVAAVCDFTAQRKHDHKIHRTHTKQLNLKRTPDILAALGKKRAGRLAIGFCLETERWLENAKSKLKRKHLDGIVANYYTKTHIPFGKRRINTAFVTRDGQITHLKHKTKRQIASALLKWIDEIYRKKSFRY